MEKKKKKIQCTVCVTKNDQTRCQQQNKNMKRILGGGGRIRNKFITANKDSSIIESEKVNLMEVFSAK